MESPFIPLSDYTGGPLPNPYLNLDMYGDVHHGASYEAHITAAVQRFHATTENSQMPKHSGAFANIQIIGGTNHLAQSRPNPQTIINDGKPRDGIVPGPDVQVSWSNISQNAFVERARRVLAEGPDAAVAA